MSEKEHCERVDVGGEKVDREGSMEDCVRREGRLAKSDSVRVEEVEGK